MARCGMGSRAPWAWGTATLALVLSSARVHAAAPEAREPPPTASHAREAAVLHVEVTPGIDDAALLPGWIAERHPELAQARREPERAPEQRIAVHIEGSTYDYRVTVTALRGGEPLGPRAEPTRCECTTEELLALVDVQIAAASEALRRPVEPAREPGPEVAPAPTDAEHPLRAARPDPRARPRRLGPLGITGIGMGVVGAGAVAAGVVLVMRPAEIRGGPERIEIRDFHVAGVGTTTAGSVLLAAGVAMILVDRLAPRRRATALVPVAGPRLAGASLVGRF